MSVCGDQGEWTLKVVSHAHLHLSEETHPVCLHPGAITGLVIFLSKHVGVEDASWTSDSCETAAKRVMTKSLETCVRLLCSRYESRCEPSSALWGPQEGSIMKELVLADFCTSFC